LATRWEKATSLAVRVCADKICRKIGVGKERNEETGHPVYGVSESCGSLADSSKKNIGGSSTREKKRNLAATGAR